MEFNRIVAACVVVTAAGWALERGLKQAAEKNRQREEYRVYENAGGLLLTIMIALIVLLFVCRAVYPEYLNGKTVCFLCNRCLCHCELSQGNFSVLYNADYGHRHGDFVPGQKRKNTDDGNIRASCDGVGRRPVETRKDRGI